MARLAATAQRQVASLGLYYSVNNRVEALELLRRAVSKALDRVDDPNTIGRSHPANYRGAISNVIWQGANIPKRIVPFDDTP